jgi:hypothetical protein
MAVRISNAKDGIDQATELATSVRTLLASRSDSETNPNVAATREELDEAIERLQSARDRARRI